MQIRQEFLDTMYEKNLKETRGFILWMSQHSNVRLSVSMQYVRL